VNTDGTYKVLIDNESAQIGSLTNWDFLPLKKIKDPEAKNCDDWVDEAEPDNLEDVKPEDLRASWGRDGREAQKDQLRHWKSEFPTLDLTPPFPFLESQHFLLWFVCFQQ